MTISFEEFIATELMYIVYIYIFCKIMVIAYEEFIFIV